ASCPLAVDDAAGEDAPAKPAGGGAPFDAPKMADAMLPKMLIPYSSYLPGDRALHHPRGFLLSRKPTVRRELIDQVRQMLTKSFEQFVGAQAGLPGESIERFAPEGFFQIGWCNLVVRSAIDPGLCYSALPTILQIVDQTAETAAQHAACGSAAQDRSQSARHGVASHRFCAARSTTEQAAENIRQASTGSSRSEEHTSEL